jgi:phosphoglycolate phosphatase-like HAD superfamily hydrolase
MDQITQIDNIPPSKFYIFDWDNTMVRHTNTCMDRVPTIAGAVVNAYTGIQNVKAGEMAIKSFVDTQGDGFAVFRPKYGDDAYFSMHRQFNALTTFDKTGTHHDQLPDLLLELSQHAHVCIASHCTQTELEMAMTRKGYNPYLIANHSYGLEKLGGFKNDPNLRVLKGVSDSYDVDRRFATLIEDSQENIDCAQQLGFGRTVLINDTQTVEDFIKSELKKIQTKQHLQRTGARQCLPV